MHGRPSVANCKVSRQPVPHDRKLRCSGMDQEILKYGNLGFPSIDTVGLLAVAIRS